MTTRLPRRQGRLLVALALSSIACRPPANGSDLDPELWDHGWFALGGSTAGDEYFTRKRPREGEVGRVYVVIVDHRCQLIPGVVSFRPWQNPALSQELDPELVRELEQRFAGMAEPASELAEPTWQIPASGGVFDLPPGTWEIVATPNPTGRPWPEHAITRIFAHVTATVDDDFALLLHHAVPPRTRNWDKYTRRIMRRSGRYSWRCFAGDDLTPRFDVRLDEAARCDAGSPGCEAVSD